jgi:amphi-Trp domain-containing protein
MSTPDVGQALDRPEDRLAALAAVKGELMDIFEVEQKETLKREEVAERLRKLADMLARHNEIEFERGGMKFTVNVPDEVQLKVEIDIETDERELEIELSW